ncbi:MFS transporter [Listeria newyorkensis]|uniref:MFS transporter n=1 Tax=Listeria newyorkensis TaxID=1497681 RepID=A0ABX4XN64_9LIST|nr:MULTISPECIES: MFS transporter [Listeria]KGL44884.1 MFS transporter [Listeriaceae bacterium FSL A5-0209]KGL40991.1 MFS transporter [Listeria newyorkensis]PNP92469.1 MFS transporter [Listeria newyorkensis]RQW68405.1 MFS transporter [Listeria sp. SHR_NRA_18]WAO21420.2 MFS transporter [Listeria newyorkensis]
MFFKNAKWRASGTVLVLLWFCWLLSFLDRMVITVALPYIAEDFELTSTHQGLIISTFFMGYALFQIPGGMLADRFGFRKMTSIAVGFWSLFTMLTGVIFYYPLFLGVRFFFGLGEAPLPGSSYKAIATYYPKRLRGRMTSIQSTVNTLGPAFASVLAAYFISVFGWRHLFIFLAIPGFVVAFLFYRLVRDNPKDNPRMSAEALQELEEDEPTVNVTKPKAKMSTIFKNSLVWKAGLVWFFFDLTFWGFTSWLPSYLMNERNLSLQATGFYNALPYLVGTVAMLLGGAMSDRFKEQRRFIFAISILVAAVSLFFIIKVPSIELALVLQCVTAWFLFLSQGIFWGIVVDILPTDQMATGSSVVNCLGSIAGIVSPIFIGKLLDISGGSYATTFTYLAICLVLAGLIVPTLKTQKTI